MYKKFNRVFASCTVSVILFLSDSFVIILTSQILFGIYIIFYILFENSIYKRFLHCGYVDRLLIFYTCEMIPILCLFACKLFKTIVSSTDHTLIIHK